jgi:hypothetical protein
MEGLQVGAGTLSLNVLTFYINFDYLSYLKYFNIYNFDYF